MNALQFGQWWFVFLQLSMQYGIGTQGQHLRKKTLIIIDGFKQYHVTKSAITEFQSILWDTKRVVTRQDRAEARTSGTWSRSLVSVWYALASGTRGTSCSASWGPNPQSDAWSAQLKANVKMDRLNTSLCIVICPEDELIIGSCKTKERKLLWCVWMTVYHLI